MSATFTGSSYLSVASVPASQNFKTSPITLAMWVRPTTAGGTLIDTGTVGYYCGIVSSNVDPGPPVNFMDTAAIFNDSSNGTWFFDVEINEFTEEAAIQGDSNTLNTWVHYAATFDGTSGTSGFKLYKNGAALTPSSTSNTLASTVAWNRVVVGGFSGDGQDCFIFNRALSAAEISSLYLGRTERVSTANIVGHWPLFGDNLGLDISGQGRNLTATGTVVKGSNNAPTSNWFPGSTRSLRTLAVASSFDLGTTAGTTNVTGSVALTELAAVTAAGTTNVTGSVTLGAAEAITPAGTTNVTGSVTLGGLAALQPAGTTNVTGSVTLTETAALAPSGTTNVTGSVGLGMTAPLAPSGTTNVTGSVALGAMEPLAPVGTTNTTGSVNIGELAAISPAGTTATTGQVTLGNSSGLDLGATAGTTNVSGSVSLTELADLGGTSGTTQTTGAVAFGAIEAVQPAGTTQTTGSISLGMTAPLSTPTGTTRTTGTVDLGTLLQVQSAGTTSVTGVVSLGELAAIQPAGTTNATGAVTMGKVIAFPGAGMTSTFGFVTLAGGTGTTPTGGPFKGNVSRRTMYAGRRRMRIL